MKQLVVKHLPEFEYQNEEAWHQLEKHRIDQVNWKPFPYCPEVNFRIVHNGSMLYIKYDIAEKHDVRSLCTQDQDPVYQDSCVEFFFLDSTGTYHNFEFNSKGFCLSAEGKNRTQRQARNKEALSAIIRSSSPLAKVSNTYQWSLIVGIPFVSLGIVREKSYRANFYKCGDLTPETHYLSWNKILTPKPDFHRPEFFGNIEIE